MATSGSADREDWIATASVYSGRPDPQWRVSADLATALARMWHAMEPCDGARAAVPRLGYRGVSLRRAESVWHAFAGVVTLTHADTPPASRRDRDRAFERTLLASAPPQTLPEGLP